MAVYPEVDGSLRVDTPTAATRYDLGNQRLYVTLTGTGTTQRIVFADGIAIGGWNIEVYHNGKPLAFQQGRAIGNSWELRGTCHAIRVSFRTVLPLHEAAVLQSLTVQNTGDENARLCVVVRVHPPEKRRAHHFLSAAVTQARLAWARGAAKQAQPAAIGPLHIEKAGILQATSPIRCTWGSLTDPTSIVREDGQIVVTFWLDVAAGEQEELRWGVCEGDAAQLAEMLRNVPRVISEVKHFHVGILQRLPSHSDPLLKSMVLACCHTALANFKVFSAHFAGFLAGVDYHYPPRLYFRDGYWTAQVAVRLRPDWVRRHILSLACGVHDDGQCPSGVFAPTCLPFPAQQPGDLDWLPDHLDSPALFILLVRDYIRVTGDQSVLLEGIPYPFPSYGRRTVWSALQAAGQYLRSRDRNGDGLLEKPYRANDWCDNIRRSTWVTYDQALYAAALFALSELAERLGLSEEAEHWRRDGDRATAALNTVLWEHERQHYIDYRRQNFTENHLALDTLVAAYFHLVPPERMTALLQQTKQLLTKYNAYQPFGDWGVLNVYPLYQCSRDLFGKSAQPYHYHNGADWPYLDGLFGIVALREQDEDTQYILTRWWSYSLAQGWLTPIEYYSPAYPPGGTLQAWSALPAAPFLS